MMPHANRSRRKDAPPAPNNIGAWIMDLERGKTGTAERIKQLRAFAVLTKGELASRLHRSLRWLEECEAGRVEMHPNDWIALRCICHAEIARNDQVARELRDASNT